MDFEKYGLKDKLTCNLSVKRCIKIVKHYTLHTATLKTAITQQQLSHISRKKKMLVFTVALCVCGFFFFLIHILMILMSF